MSAKYSSLRYLTFLEIFVGFLWILTHMQSHWLMDVAYAWMLMGTIFSSIGNWVKGKKFLALYPLFLLVFAAVYLFIKLG